MLVSLSSDATSVEALPSSTIITSLIPASRNLNSARIIDALVKEEEVDNEDFKLLRA